MIKCIICSGSTRETGANCFNEPKSTCDKCNITVIFDANGCVNYYAMSVDGIWVEYDKGCTNFNGKGLKHFTYRYVDPSDAIKFIKYRNF
jgi:hypothetical protein